VSTGLALAQLADATGDETFRRAASSMADYALSCQQPNGWFRENDLEDHTSPLTHTIGYVLEGLHGIGRMLGRQDCLDAVRLTLSRIAGFVGENGVLPGRWFGDWTPAVNWVCLTGSAQIAGVYLGMNRDDPVPANAHAGRRLLGFVAYTQELGSDHPGLEGAIRGSFPFSGGYCQWSCPNWAAKFFADSIMDDSAFLRHSDRSQSALTAR
jgi:hypothetical protein